MPISERGYTHWNGQLLERARPWRPIARLGIKLSLKRKWFKFTLAVSMAPAFMFAVGVFIAERVGNLQFLRPRRETLLAVDPEFFKAYFAGDFLLFMMVMLMILAGAGLICDDLKHNALQLYFARPLRKRDYLAGKAGVVSFFLLLVTLVPGTLFILLKLVFSGSLRFLADYPWIPVAVVLDSAVLTGFFAVYTLAISSLGRNRRFVSILLFLVYILSDLFFDIFYGLFREPAFCLISIKNNLQQVGAGLFRAKPFYDVPWLYSALVLAVLAGAGAFLLARRIKSVEVIR